MAIQKVLEAYGSDIIGSHVEVGAGGHEILNPSGTSMTQEEKMQFTGNVTVTDDSTNGKTVVNIEDSGHTIKNSSGTAMTQQPNMKFSDSFVTNDSVGEATVVENVKSVASADYPSETEDGMYLIPDGEGAVIGPASDDKVEVTADGVKTWGTLLSELYNDVESDKLTLSSQIELVVGSYKAMYYVQNISSSEYIFVNIGDRTTKVRTTTMVLSSTSSIYDVYEGTNDPLTNNSPANGTKITLYYGNKKATVDLQTTANRCWYDANNTVKQKLDSLPFELVETTGTTDSSGYFNLGANAKIIACVPKDYNSACQISAILVNQWDITYAVTDKPSTNLTLLCIKIKS